MITEKQIDQFYKDLDSLKLKFPVAAVSKATGFGKSTVSVYLTRKKEPSETFLEAFYNSFNFVPHETNPKTDEAQSKAEEIFLNGPIKVTAQEYVDALKSDKERLEDSNRQLQDVISVNLQAMQLMLDSLRRHDQAFHETILKSLARLEKKKPEDSLIVEAHTRNAALQLEEQGSDTVKEDT